MSAIPPPFNDPRWASIFQKAQKEADDDVLEGFRDSFRLVKEAYPDLPPAKVITKVLRAWFRFLCELFLLNGDKDEVFLILIQFRVKICQRI